LEQETKTRLVLASSSVYRRMLLERLQLPFVTMSPAIDESALEDEPAPDTASRLSRLKAQAARDEYPRHLIIGSDQVAECDGTRLDKPLRHDRASAQLRWVSGKKAVFHSALTLLNGKTGRQQTRVVATRVRFRSLSETEIERYLQREPAFDCAGSAKSEGLGIALIAAIEGDDPTALVGLPLIALCEMLRSEGVAVP
jgi:septum formation protein